MGSIRQILSLLFTRVAKTASVLCVLLLLSAAVAVPRWEAVSRWGSRKIEDAAMIGFDCALQNMWRNQQQKQSKFHARGWAYAYAYACLCVYVSIK
jgi:hypothetical protein